MHLALVPLLVLLLKAPTGESQESPPALSRTKHTGGGFWHLASPATRDHAGPCPEKYPNRVRRTLLPLVWKRKDPGLPLGPVTHPTGSRVIPAPEGTLLVEREKDLSTYNWNSFGLRYGKRQDEDLGAKAWRKMC